MTKVGEWLDGIGLSQYITIFDENDIGYGELTELTEDDLRNLGVSIGHMRRILSAARDLQKQSAPAERRQLTVLFADIVGFTKMSSDLDPEDLLDVVNSFQATCNSVIQEFRGTLVKFVGDGVLAFFGWPIASEPDAINCIRAAKKLTQVINAEIAVEGRGLQVRAGVATGLVVVGDLASNMPDVFGDVPNLAARLQSVAEPGSVVISDSTHQLVSGVFDCDQTNALEIKGLGKITAWKVGSELDGSGAARLSLPTGGNRMEGRDEELATLNGLWDAAMGGRFQMACIEGEAGLGKSRLATEFLYGVRKQADILTFFGSPDAGQTPLRPIVDLIERVAGFQRWDTPDKRVEKLENLIRTSELEAPGHISTFLDVCGLRKDEALTATTAERRRAMLFEGVKSLIESRAAKKPVVVLFEDLHWLDPTTLELSKYLAELQADRPILLLATTRPEQAAPWPDGKAFSNLRLAPLSKEHATLILQETLGGGNDVLANVIGQILRRADGIPLYLEELSRSVHLTIDNLEIPSTLQDSLMARLDRLGDVREIAQVASILGRDIDLDLLAEVLDQPIEQVRIGLEGLVVEQVLTKSLMSGDAEAQYRFRHALLQEAAYDSQLKRKRREAHATAADVLTKWEASGQSVPPENIAFHLSKSRRSAEAVPYYRKAGLIALGDAHYEDAQRLLENAQEELGKATEAAGETTEEVKTSALEMKTELGSVLIAREGFGAPAVGEAFADAERIGRELGPGPALARALWGNWLYNLVSGKLARALELSQELHGLGEAFASLDGSGLLTEASWALGNSQFWVGQLDDSAASLQKSIDLYDAEAHADHALIYGQDPLVAANCYAAYTQSCRGYHSRSWAAQKAAVAHARTTGHPFSIAWSLSFPALTATFRGEGWAAHRLSTAALQHTSEQMMPFWQTAMTMVHGWSRVRMGEIKGGLAEAEAGLAAYCSIGSKTVQPYFRGMVADCMVRAGRLEDAGNMIRSAFEVAHETGENLSLTWLHIAAAEHLQAQGASESQITDHLEAGLKLSRELGASAPEVNAAYALAKMHGKASAEVLRDVLARAPEPAGSRTGRRALALLAEFDEEPVLQT